MTPWNSTGGPISYSSTPAFLLSNTNDFLPPMLEATDGRQRYKEENESQVVQRHHGLQSSKVYSHMLSSQLHPQLLTDQPQGYCSFSLLFLHVRPIALLGLLSHLKSFSLL